MDDIHEAAAAPHYWGIGIRLVGSTQMRVGFVSYKSQCYTQNMANLLWELQWSLTESGIKRTQFDPSRGLQGAHRMGVNTKWERERERERASQWVIPTGNHVIGYCSTVISTDVLQDACPDYSHIAVLILSTLLYCFTNYQQHYITTMSTPQWYTYNCRIIYISNFTWYDLKVLRF